MLSDSRKIYRFLLRVTECIFLNQWVLKQNYYHEGGALGILKGKDLWIGCVPVESKKELEGLGVGIKGKMEAQRRKRRGEAVSGSVSPA